VIRPGAGSLAGSMDLADFDYALPPERIAQTPVEPRDAARLLVDRGTALPPEHRTVADLADLVGPGDVVVVNDTRVLPARLDMRKPTGGAVEVLLLAPAGDGWEALVRPSRKVAEGTVVRPASGDSSLAVEVGADLGDGRRHVRVLANDDLYDTLDRVGQVPLPPYIHEPLDDPDRYQTVYAVRPESVAAPTAGLHFTTDLLSRVEAAGAEIHRVELAVGLGTFRPITAERVEDHVMHAERYQVPDATWEACQGADRVVAIGTTVTRALESAATRDRRSGHTDLFIHQGYDWKVVDVMLTNFHVPCSSLLVMIDAFVGPRWRHLYDVALAEGYRFLSFGDAMLLDRHAA
jgi:S-adenosylmethionine:tRNA ribosyltransferase-isomerase